MKPFILFLLLFSFSGQLFAQFSERYLVLDKPSAFRKHRIRFNAGEDIILKMKNSRKADKITISKLTDTSIVMGTIDIPLSEVRSVVVYRKGSLRNSAMVLLPIAGAMFFLADTFNKANGEHPNVSSWGIRTGGSMAGVGITLLLTKKRTYKLTWYRSLHVLQTF